MKNTNLTVFTVLFCAIVFLASGASYGQTVKSAVPAAKTSVVAPTMVQKPATPIYQTAPAVTPKASTPVIAPKVSTTAITPAAAVKPAIVSASSAPTITPVVTIPRVAMISAFEKAAIFALAQQDSTLTRHMLKNNVSPSKVSVMTADGKFMDLTGKKAVGKFLVTDIVFDKRKKPIEVAGIGKFTTESLGTDEQRFGNVPEMVGAFSVKLSSRTTAGIEFITVTRYGSKTTTTHYYQNSKRQWEDAWGNIYDDSQRTSDSVQYGQQASPAQIESMKEGDRAGSGGSTQSESPDKKDETPPSSGGGDDTSEPTCNEEEGDNEDGDISSDGSNEGTEDAGCASPPCDDGSGWPNPNDWVGNWVDFNSDGTSMSINMFRDRGQISKLSTGSVSNYGPEQDAPGGSIPGDKGPHVAIGTGIASNYGPDQDVPSGGVPGGRGPVSTIGAYKLNYWMTSDLANTGVSTGVSGINVGASAAFGEQFGGLTGGVKPGGGDPVRMINAKTFTCQVK